MPRSTAAPAPQSTYNECLLCGEPATLRCAACLQKGSIELFFCSREHQKLIWPVHRLFCGERAHPIRMPPVSQAEAEAICARLSGAATRPEPDAGRNAVNALLDRQYGSDRSRADEDKVKAMVFNFVGKDCSFVYPPALAVSDPDGKRIHRLRLLRLALYSVPTPQLDKAALLQQLVNRLINAQDNLEPIIQCLLLYYIHCPSEKINAKTLWYSRFCHRLFAQAILRELVEPGLSRALFNAAEMRRFRRKSLQVMQKYLRTTQTAANREFAKEALRVVESQIKELDASAAPSGL